MEELLSSDESNVEETEEELASNAAAAASSPPNIPKSSHASFMLSGTKVRGDETSPDDGPSHPDSSPSVPDTAVYEETSASGEGPAAPYKPPKRNNEEENAAAAATLHQRGSDQAQRHISKEILLPVQQSRGLPEAVALLSATTKDLEGRVNILLSQHEEDFFAAFRSHMATVQRHMQYLRDCADAQKNLMMRDVKVKTLQNELWWFAEEAIRLDQVLALRTLHHCDALRLRTGASL